uniref:SCCA2/SCCA1 fusion protein isoform 1 (Predicted) n=1 Tax=Rhinolophus ferrumequinum TaxID=59479 RepID=B2KI28_RHIFE|nr:SCCA2/SCCA1 fusion protein isoform 1 (predicted) [Rhinolophus ferrumequinum]
MSSLSEANTRFAYDLFQQFRKSEKENIFYSPLSITSALAMTYLGSRGQTASTMQKVLHFNEVTENTKGEATKVPVEKSGDVHYQFQKLLTELNKPTDDYELNIANRLYGEKKFQFLQEYKNNVKKFYLASVESVDFVNAAEESRMMINSWVESQTNEKIKNLFPEDSLDSSTILVLVNAVYFKGQWNEKFDPKNTEQGEFWQNKDTSKPVQMMKQTSYFNFTSLEDVQAKILEIPYKGEDLSMLLLLPNEIDGLQKLEDQLTAEKLIEWTSSQNMSKRKVELRLPRFKVEESYALGDTMRALGMGNAFTPGDADFSGMTGSRGFVLSQIVHKSFVEVTEEGTEAAAATGIVIGRTSVQMYEHFHCDHPFLFFIKHNETNSILFFGRISTPDM